MAARSAGSALTAYDLMDATRALAAIVVLVSHARNILFFDRYAGPSLPWKFFYFLTGFGHQAVMVFFVLSGYWITKTVVRRSADSGFAWSDYAIDRLSRLWIVLVPALLLGGALDAIGIFGTQAPLYLGVQGTEALRYPVASHLTLTNFVGSLAFLQTLRVKYFGSNTPLWSLAHEFWYYVWFPPIYLALSRRRQSILILALVLLSVYAFHSQLLPGFLCWLLGSLVYFFTRNRAAGGPARSGMTMMLIAATALLLAVLTGTRTYLPGYGAKDIAISAAFAFFLFALIRAPFSYPRWLRPLCEFGAGSSYSLYVVHFPLVVLLAALFVAPAHRLPPSPGLFADFVAICAVAIAYAYAISRVTEARTEHVRRWIRNRLRAQSATHASKSNLPTG
jgi:peptidoglycan/LPS O-acetylase OafA/YrhL